MRKAVLDTDILSEISKGIDKLVLANASDYLDQHGRLTFSSVSLYEILYGLKAKPALRQVERFLQSIEEHEEIVPDTNDYRLAADIRAALHLAGREIGRADPVIAAIAIRRDLPLVTGNVKHYSFVQETGFALLLDNWRIG